MGTENRGCATPRTTLRLVFGLGILALGVLLTLENLGVVDAVHLFRLWPVILIAVGVSQFLQPIRGQHSLQPLLWILAGAVLLGNALRLYSLRGLWPLALIVVGAWIATKTLRGPQPEARVAGGLRVDSDEYLRSVAFMGGIRRGTCSQSLQGGEAVAFMGGVEIDLRQAGVAESEASFDCVVCCGGIKISVPEDWEVVNRGLALMGGFEDKTRRPELPRGRLVVSGVAVMGGVEIVNR